ncbi:hypothetical protein PIB30_091198, partial [Stylosanthes scabra]|nr:hypothetical protein [Stylosanthes scabra]
WGEVGLDQCRWGWVRHWWLVGAGRVTHRLATTLNHCMSAVGRGATLVAEGVTRGKATALGRWEVTSGVPAALVEEGVPWVSPATLVHLLAY